MAFCTVTDFVPARAARFLLAQGLQHEQLLSGFQLRVVQGLRLALNNVPGAPLVPPPLVPLLAAQAAACAAYGVAASMAGVGMPAGPVSDSPEGEGIRLIGEDMQLMEALVREGEGSGEKVREEERRPLGEGEDEGLMESLVAVAMDDVEGLNEHLQSLLHQ